jgi:iron complex transport system substrate-binding protein
MLAGNWTPELIELAGGSSIVPGTQTHSRYWTWEELTAASPDVVVIAPCGFDFERSLAEARRLASHPLWPLLPAVQSQRVFVVDGNAYLNRSGPRIVDTLEILAHILHPAHFPRPAHSGWRRVSQTVA